MNEGLRLEAERVGKKLPLVCPRCKSQTGLKLDPDHLMSLAYYFFVWGSLHKSDYGAASVIKFRDSIKTDIDLPFSLRKDVVVFEESIDIGFFPYGPRLWMLGEIEPLKDLQCRKKRSEVIKRILNEYESRTVTTQEKFYRLRKNPKRPSLANEYDSPPTKSSNDRLDKCRFPVLYASHDPDICLHECRASAQDKLYIAALRPTQDLRLLDLLALLDESEDTTEFESLELAVDMLFSAGGHSYPITQELACAARDAGYDGIRFPSYFSRLHIGVEPVETIYGISNRMFPQLRKFEEAKLSANIAVFGRPIRDGLVEVCCVNRMVVRNISYYYHYGPVLDDSGVRTSAWTDGSCVKYVFCRMVLGIESLLWRFSRFRFFTRFRR